MSPDVGLVLTPASSGVLTAALVLVLVGMLVALSRRRPRDFPPAPPGVRAWPLLGHLPALGPEPHRTLAAWTDGCGDVIGVRFGTSDVVVLNSLEAMREALVAPGDAFSSRPRMFMMDIFSDGGKGGAPSQTCPSARRDSNVTGRTFQDPKARKYEINTLSGVVATSGLPVHLSCSCSHVAHDGLTSARRTDLESTAYFKQIFRHFEPPLKPDRGKPALVTVALALLLSLNYSYVKRNIFAPVCLVFRKFGKSLLEQRKFAMVAFRDILSRPSTESMMVREAQTLAATLARREGQPARVHENIGLSLLNVMCSLCFGRRFETSDPKFCGFVQSLDMFAKNAASCQLYNICPALARIPKLNGPAVRVKTGIKEVKEFVRTETEGHKVKFDKDNIRDIIDAFLLEVESRMRSGRDLGSFTEREMEQVIFDLFFTGAETSSTCLRWAVFLMAVIFDLFFTGAETSSTCLRWAVFLMAVFPHVQACIHCELYTIFSQVIFSSLQVIFDLFFTGAETSSTCLRWAVFLMAVIFDLFFTGAETSSTCLRWAVFLMAVFPHVQARIHRELDAALGPHGEVSLDKRAQLPYLEATISEVVSSKHFRKCATKDSRLRGYSIPENTQKAKKCRANYRPCSSVFVKYPDVTHSRDFMGGPNVPILVNLWSVHMDPKHWQDPDQFNPERFLNPEGTTKLPEAFKAFGLGRRLCFGEQMARMEIFLFFAILMRHFTFKLPEGAPVPNTMGVFALTLSPPPHELCIFKRN
ncbi:hypothetical protein Bbelb_296550 [Branchiostoma belcheri]|nr:hypothetical protein Bbelb_296550 [Branchiostoma belcheri]